MCFHISQEFRKRSVKQTTFKNLQEITREERVKAKGEGVAEEEMVR